MKHMVDISNECDWAFTHQHVEANKATILKVESKAGALHQRQVQSVLQNRVLIVLLHRQRVALSAKLLSGLSQHEAHAQILLDQHIVQSERHANITIQTIQRCFGRAKAQCTAVASNLGRGSCQCGTSGNRCLQGVEAKQHGNRTRTGELHSQGNKTCAFCIPCCLRPAAAIRVLFPVAWGVI